MDIDNIKNVLAAMKNSESEKRFVVTKSFPMKEEWIHEFNLLHKAADEMNAKMAELISRRDGMWAMINKGLNSYDKPRLRINEETMEVEVLEDPTDGKAVKSPLQSHDIKR